MTFNISTQTGGIINNVARDQHITGGQHTMLATADDARQALHNLREALAAADLNQATAAAAATQVTQATAALHPAYLDRPRAARALEQLTHLLISAGSLSSATTALIAPLQALAGWLGTLGQPIMHLLSIIS
jgi:hypothetical protein